MIVLLPKAPLEPLMAKVMFEVGTVVTSLL